MGCPPGLDHGSEMIEEKHSSASVQHHYCLFETAFGVCGVAWTEIGLSRVQLPERDTAATEQRLQRGTAAVPWGAEPPLPIAQCIAMLRRYCEGATTDFRSIELDHRGIGPFNAEIYRALRNVGWGQTTTYGALARGVSAPDAARAVGAAMSCNPWPIVVPCHRVLASGQRMGGFSAHGGSLTKGRLLALEGIHLASATPLLPGLFPVGRFCLPTPR